MINFSKRKYLLTLKKKTPTLPKLLSFFSMRSTLTTTERFRKRSCMTTLSNKKQTGKKKTASHKTADRPRISKETEHG